MRSLTRFRPWTILGTGVLIDGGLALLPVLLGDPVLDTAYASVDLPVLGTVSLSTTLLFDVGVYLVVVGLVLMVFEAFGDDLEPVDAGPDALDEPDPLDDELTPATVELEQDAEAVTEAVDGAAE